MTGKIWLSLAAAVLAAGCAGPAPEKKSEPAPKAPETAKPAPLPTAPVTTPKPAPAPVDSKPIPADLAKAVTPTENAQLFGYDNDRLFWYTGGVITIPVAVPADGEYAIVINAACDEAQGQKAKFKLTVDGQPVGAETTLTSTDPMDYTLPAALKAGERKIGIEFTNDIYKENEYDLNLYVGGLTLKRTK